jgi:transposase
VKDWAEVHRLHERQKKSRRQIAKELKISRTTVDRLLGLSEPPAYVRERAPSLLDPFREAILAFLEQDPRVRATVIRERLQAQGYAGGITILKDYLQEVRPQFLAARTYQRTSYLPGELGQVDWWELPMTMPVADDVLRKVFGLVVTLPHSAAHACFFTHTQTLYDFLPALLRCLERLGGVPEGLVLDNDTSIVVHVPGHRSRLHVEVAALFGALRTRPIVLPPRRPESKGQVERTIDYLENSFLPLRTFTDLADLQAQHDTWAREKAYPRYHRRVGARVTDAYRVEKGHLGPLPNPLPDTDRHTETRITKDAFIRAGGVDYSVPPGLVGRRAHVRVSLTEVVVHLEGREIARHPRSYVPADVVICPEHARALRAAREAEHRLRRGDVPLEVPDLSRYDALLGVTL